MKRGFQIVYDRTANLKGISEGFGGKWPSWNRGEQIRDRIMELKQHYSEPTIEQIATHCKISTDQAKRHRANLIASGIWKICGCAIALSSSFIAGAYYADADRIDEWVSERVKFPIHELGEKIVWEWEQRFL